MDNQMEPETVGPNSHENSNIREATVRRVSILKYLKAELTRGYIIEHDEAKLSEKRQKVYTFLKIPVETEKFMLYGFLQCAEAFLYVFTFLPVRFLLATIQLLTHPCGVFNRSPNQRLLEPAQICDLLKGVILLICCFLMNYVDTSMMYHIIRGQSIIKLYIFFNMLEVADRLFSSVGQDILDALFWTAAEPRGRKREHIGLLPHFLLAILYVFSHAVLVLFQATTINVAFNSHNKALLTIMMSNNFVELKGSVFKKFEKNNLFQMACSDVRERFHFLVLLFIVCIRNMTEFSWNLEHLWLLIPDVIMVLGSEFLVDWVKHAFITKFNEIPEEVYGEYCAFTDAGDMISRRMGFIPLPLGCLLFRIVSQSVKINGPVGVVCIVIGYLCLVTLKMFCSIVVLGKAYDYVENDKTKGKQRHAPSHAPKQEAKIDKISDIPQDIEDKTESSSVPESDIKQRSTKPHTPLSEVDRYTMCSNRIV